jgi:thiamine biosynthesis lipoprotein
MRLWGFKDRRPHLPTTTELAGIRPFVGFEQIQIDSSTRAVRFTRPGVQIDLGGIAKGFAAELAAGSLRRRGLSGLIDLGGNQYMVGRPPGKQVWSVGVRHPDLPDALLGAVEVSGGSLSTSADSSNFVTIDGRQYGHLMDPRTLRPATASLSVTIASTDGTLADALSKAVFVLGPKAGLSLLASFPGTSAVVAFRETDGRVGVAVSPGLVFHPAH